MDSPSQQGHTWYIDTSIDICPSLLSPKEPVHQSNERGKGAVWGADRRSHQKWEWSRSFQRLENKPRPAGNSGYFFAEDFQKVFLSLLQAFISYLLSDLLSAALPYGFGSLRHNSLVPGCWDSDLEGWTLASGPVLETTPGSLQLKHTAALGESCCCFPVLKALGPMEIVKYYGQGRTTWSVVEWSEPVLWGYLLSKTQPMKLLLEAFWEIFSFVFKHSSFIEI